MVTGGTNLAFGKPLRQKLDLSKAAVIVSLDADPLGEEGSALRNARGWAAGRDVDTGKVNRLYAVESQYTSTGLAADNRLPLKSGQIGGFVAALEEEVNSRLELSGGGEVDDSLSKPEKFLMAMAQDLVANRGKSVVLAGSRRMLFKRLSSAKCRWTMFPPRPCVLHQRRVPLRQRQGLLPIRV